MDKYNHWLGKLFGWFNHNPCYAVTFWQTSYFSVSESEVSEQWHKHENCHKRQYAKYPISFLPRYVFYAILHSHDNSPFEIEAIMEEKL